MLSLLAAFYTDPHRILAASSYLYAHSFQDLYTWLLQTISNHPIYVC